MYLTEPDQAIIKTLSYYVLMGDLEQQGIMPHDKYQDFINGLTDVQQEIVSYYEKEKTEILGRFS